jgi:hypothetical protein
MMKEANRLDARTWSNTRGRSAERKAIATAAMAQVRGSPKAVRESVSAAISTARPVSGGGALAIDEAVSVDAE